MPPLVLDDDEEFPSVKEILHRIPTNRITSNIDPKHIKHIIVDPTKINNPVAAQASQIPDPKGNPPTDYDPNKPFCLLDCEDEVRQRILQHILTEPDPITPYYYERCVEGTDQETRRENFPIQMLIALAGKDSKKYYEEDGDIFYGWNKWKLTDPKSRSDGSSTSATMSRAFATSESFFRKENAATAPGRRSFGEIF
ncbi:hypothetical protein OEA41_005112 [Lepraria neglecta]|uniref:Uncharacterized protein n=1 Tax=Lepraria neglecta TaxID=209136 RepID=A0AAD9YZ52_9LECA|nr:hypothetical protein OEA41_005112 [Lepraria neglecta]